jgi:hypothetical protein
MKKILKITVTFPMLLGFLFAVIIQGNISWFLCDVPVAIVFTVLSSFTFVTTIANWYKNSELVKE